MRKKIIYKVVLSLMAAMFMLNSIAMGEPLSKEPSCNTLAPYTAMRSLKFQSLARAKADTLLDTTADQYVVNQVAHEKSILGKRWAEERTEIFKLDNAGELMPKSVIVVRVTGLFVNTKKTAYLGPELSDFSGQTIVYVDPRYYRKFLDSNIIAGMLDESVEYGTRKGAPIGVYEIVKCLYDTQITSASQALSVGDITAKLEEAFPGGDRSLIDITCVRQDLNSLYLHLKLLQKIPGNKPGEEPRYYIFEYVMKKMEQLLPEVERFGKECLRPDDDMCRNFYLKTVYPLLMQHEDKKDISSLNLPGKCPPGNAHEWDGAVPYKLVVDGEEMNVRELLGKRNAGGNMIFTARLAEGTIYIGTGIMHALIKNPRIDAPCALRGILAKDKLVLHAISNDMSDLPIIHDTLIVVARLFVASGVSQDLPMDEYVRRIYAEDRLFPSPVPATVGELAHCMLVSEQPDNGAKPEPADNNYASREKGPGKPDDPLRGSGTVFYYKPPEDEDGDSKEPCLMKVLIVCNQAKERSPMAAAMLAEHLPDDLKGKVKFSYAAWLPKGAFDDTYTKKDPVLRKAVYKQLTDDMFHNADIVFTVKEGIVKGLKDRFAKDTAKVSLLLGDKELDTTLADHELDPGTGLYYQALRDEITAKLDDIYARVRKIIKKAYGDNDPMSGGAGRDVRNDKKTDDVISMLSMLDNADHHKRLELQQQMIAMGVSAIDGLIYAVGYPQPHASDCACWALLEIAKKYPNEVLGAIKKEAKKQPNNSQLVELERILDKNKNEIRPILFPAPAVAEQNVATADDALLSYIANAKDASALTLEQITYLAESSAIQCIEIPGFAQVTTVFIVSIPGIDTRFKFMFDGHLNTGGGRMVVEKIDSNENDIGEPFVITWKKKSEPAERIKDALHRIATDPDDGTDDDVSDLREKSPERSDDSMFGGASGGAREANRDDKNLGLMNDLLPPDQPGPSVHEYPDPDLGEFGVENKRGKKTAAPDAGQVLTRDEIAAAVDELAKRDTITFSGQDFNRKIIDKITSMKLVKGKSFLVAGTGRYDLLPILLAKLGLKVSIIEPDTDSLYEMRQVVKDYKLEDSIHMFDSYDEMQNRKFDYVSFFGIIQSIIGQIAFSELTSAAYRSSGIVGKVRHLESTVDDECKKRLKEAFGVLVRYLNPDGGYLFITSMEIQTRLESKNLKYIRTVMDELGREQGISFTEDDSVDVDDLSLVWVHKDEKRLGIVFRADVKPAGTVDENKALAPTAKEDKKDDPQSGGASGGSQETNSADENMACLKDFAGRISSFDVPVFQGAEVLSNVLTLTKPTAQDLIGILTFSKNGRLLADLASRTYADNNPVDGHAVMKITHEMLYKIRGYKDGTCNQWVRMIINYNEKKDIESVNFVLPARPDAMTRDILGIDHELSDEEYEIYVYTAAVKTARLIVDVLAHQGFDFTRNKVRVLSYGEYTSSRRSIIDRSYLNITDLYELSKRTLLTERAGSGAPMIEIAPDMPVTDTVNPGDKINNTLKVMNNVLKPAAIKEGRFYTISYDSARLRANIEQTGLGVNSTVDQLIRKYVEFLKMGMGPDANDDAIQLVDRPSIGKKEWPLISVTCYKDIAHEVKIGEAFVNVQGKLYEKKLDIVGMLNLAFTASNVPNNISRTEREHYKDLLDLANEFYKALTGKQELPKDIWNIVLDTIKPIEPQELAEYYTRTIEQLRAA